MPFGLRATLESLVLILTVGRAPGSVYVHSVRNGVRAVVGPYRDLHEAGKRAEWWRTRVPAAAAVLREVDLNPPTPEAGWYVSGARGTTSYFLVAGPFPSRRAAQNYVRGVNLAGFRLEDAEYEYVGTYKPPPAVTDRPRLGKSSPVPASDAASRS
jgi:hypothetical protein